VSISPVAFPALSIFRAIFSKMNGLQLAVLTMSVSLFIVVVAVFAASRVHEEAPWARAPNPIDPIQTKTEIVYKFNHRMGSPFPGKGSMIDIYK
jgi:hypothetical protein